MIHIATIVALLLIYQAFEHNCVHHKIVNDTGNIKKGDPRAFFKNSDYFVDKDRLLDENEWRNINIVFDTSLIERIDRVYKTYIKDVALPIVKDKFESFTSVHGPSTIPPFTSTHCDSLFEVPSQYSSKTTNADLLIFVNIIHEHSSFLAFAAPCKFEPTYNRPVVGVITINETALRISPTDLEIFVLVLVHESLHILVISPNLYGLYNIEGQAVVKELRNTPSGPMIAYKLRTPRIVDTARDHYNCSNLNSVYLEDEGSSASAGAHFEKIKFGNELMTSRISGYPVLSTFTFALMEDSGWYQVDHNKAQHLAFGNMAGCSFFEDKCSISHAEFCNVPQSLACSKKYMGKTICKTSPFSNNCFIKEYESDIVCTNQYNFIQTIAYEESGPFSRCFVAGDNRGVASGCFKAMCERGLVVIQIEDSTLECTMSGEIIEYKDISIICPDIALFCNYMDKACTEDCNGFGICLIDNTCRCDYLYSGDYCETYVGCKVDDQEFCDLLLSTLRMTIDICMAILLFAIYIFE